MYELYCDLLYVMNIAGIHLANASDAEWSAIEEELHEEHYCSI